MPLAWTLALLDPPFQGPDEGAHFARAVQVGQGGFVASAGSSGYAGGRLPVGVRVLIGVFDDLKWRPVAPVGRARVARAGTVKWSGPRLFTPFPNTAIYPPWFYAPQAIAIDAGRLAGLRVLECTRLARLAGATIATLLAALAIDRAVAGAFLAAILGLPMTLALFASASQDGCMIATTALVAAFLSRRRERPASWPRWLLAGLALGAIGSARAPYLLFCALPPLVARTDRRRAAAASVLGLASAVCWIIVGTAPALSPTQAGGSVLGGAQMAFLRAHPWSVLQIALLTIEDFWQQYLDQVIGVLNWLDVALPLAFYDFAVAVVLLLALLALRSARLATGAVLLATAGLVFGALYITWSPAGSPVVAGVQGRYLTPILAMASLLLGRGRAPALSTALVGILLLADWLVVPSAIARHYTLAWPHL